MVALRFFRRAPCRVPRAAWALIGAVATALHPRTAEAQGYVCPPSAAGVPGLLGGPKFTENIPPDPLASLLDDPRWSGAFREDFATVSGATVRARLIKEGNYLFMSLAANVDPDGAAINADGVFMGFSRDGLTAEMVKVTFTAAPPLTNSPNISSFNWWKTTDGGATPWPKQPGPLPWAMATNIHAWAGTGTGNGDSWAINAKIDLAAVGAHLDGGAPLTSNFYMWFEINVQTAAGPIPYDWPAGIVLSFNGMNQAILQATSAFWANVYPTTASNCPKGISIDPMNIGVTPLTSGVPSTIVHYGMGQPPNNFVAELDNDSQTIPNNSVKARFRLSDWTSTVGMDGVWRDIVPRMAGTPGTRSNLGPEAKFRCVNPPDTSTDACPQLAVGAPTHQCLLVELSDAAGGGQRFVRDSAYACVEMTNGQADGGLDGSTPISDGSMQLDGASGRDAADGTSDGVGGGRDSSADGSESSGLGGAAGAFDSGNRGGGGMGGERSTGGAAGSEVGAGGGAPRPKIAREDGSCACSIGALPEASDGGRALLGVAVGSALYRSSRRRTRRQGRTLGNARAIQ